MTMQILVRVLFIFSMMMCLSVPVSMAQTNRKIRSLQSQRTELQKQINQSERLLVTTKKDVRSQLNNLVVINGKIDQQRRYIEGIQNEVAALEQHLDSLQRQLRDLERDLEERKRRYSRSLLYLYRNRSTQNKLMFIFSADNFSQMYRRLRYVQEYARYQRVQGEQVQNKQRQVMAKRAEVLRTKGQKSALLAEGKNEQQKLEDRQKERQKVVNSLQKKQKQLQRTISNSRKRYASLNAQIDKLIKEEIAAAERRRKAAEAKRRKEAERRRKAAEATRKKGGKSGSTKKSGTTDPMPEFEMERADRLLSSNFAANKGRLPMPITGPYLISSRYGHYSVAGLKGVQLDNKGINITGKSGAKARAVFNGEVSAVFSFGGYVNVMVRHGSYISVYCNLSSASVRRGQKVRTKEVLGTVARDPSGNCTLHFQLRKETAKLNPESWLIR